MIQIANPVFTINAPHQGIRRMGHGDVYPLTETDCRPPLSRRWHGASVVHDTTPSENLGFSPKVINPLPTDHVVLRVGLS